MLAILCVCALLVMPWLVNRPGVMAAFLQEFEERTGHRLSIEESAVHIFPTPGLTLTGPRLYDSPSTVPLVFAERLEIALQWVPLLEGRIVAKDLVIDHGRMEPGLFATTILPPRLLIRLGRSGCCSSCRICSWFKAP
jgi:uncharacterized protein involved in outer membrane biogenesis